LVGARPQTPLGELTALPSQSSPRPLSWNLEILLPMEGKGRGRRKRRQGKGGEEKEEKGRKRRKRKERTP